MDELKAAPFSRESLVMLPTKANCLFLVAVASQGVVGGGLASDTFNISALMEGWVTKIWHKAAFRAVKSKITC